METYQSIYRLLNSTIRFENIMNSTSIATNALYLSLSKAPIQIRQQLKLIRERNISIHNFLKQKEQFLKFSSLHSYITKKLISNINTEIDLIHKCKDLEINYCNIEEENYPKQLLNIEDSPLIIFSKGQNIELISNTKAFAIVGSRKANSEGKDIAQVVAQKLSSRNVCVVSGLAYGIDSAAHIGALKSISQLPTIAVLAHGLDRVYPTKNSNLAKQILDNNGLLISQFPPFESPKKHHFLNRNRIIAGLAQGTLVVQANARSGSLSTARHTIDQGKELYACPGNINDSLYAGSNDLIKKGANIFTSILDIDDFHKEELSSEKLLVNKITLNDNEFKILTLLNSNNTELEVLKKIINVDSFEKDLLNLEMLDLIIKKPGNKIALSLAGLEIKNNSTY